MKNLEHLLANPELNTMSIDELAEYANQMIDQYQKGKQELHRKEVNKIINIYRNGIGKTTTVESFARGKLLMLISNVCQHQKVI